MPFRIRNPVSGAGSQGGKSSAMIYKTEEEALKAYRRQRIKKILFTLIVASIVAVILLRVKGAISNDLYFSYLFALLLISVFTEILLRKPSISLPTPVKARKIKSRISRTRKSERAPSVIDSPFHKKKPSTSRSERRGRHRYLDSIQGATADEGKQAKGALYSQLRGGVYSGGYMFDADTLFTGQYKPSRKAGSKDGCERTNYYSFFQGNRIDPKTAKTYINNLKKYLSLFIAEKILKSPNPQSIRNDINGLLYKSSAPPAYPDTLRMSGGNSTKEKLFIDSCLNVPGYGPSARDYVQYRLTNLSKNNFSTYRFDKTVANFVSSRSLPTDVEILANLYDVIITESIGNGLGADHVVRMFVKSYYENPDRYPYFLLMVMEDKTTFDIRYNGVFLRLERGSENAFEAMVLFLWLFKENSQIVPLDNLSVIINSVFGTSSYWSFF